MNPSLHKVLHYLTGHEDMGEASLEDMQKLADESPYFPVVHFLLAKKSMANEEEAAGLQLHKTALYFSNPYWLHFQLHHKPSFIIPAAVPETYVDLSGNESIERSELVNHFPTKSNENGHSKDEGIGAEEISDFIDINPDIATDKKSILVNTDELETETITKSEEKTDDSTADTLKIASEPLTNEVFIAVEEDVLEDQGEPDEHEKMFQNIKAMLDATAAEADADVKSSIIQIDPYHTVDYFASQGIKLDLDQNPKDQLGKNLKKFTQWLKHMKKVGPEDVPEVSTATETDADIQRIADTSNIVKEVVTEAMAQVLEKQGKKAKAIELYDKLSFVYPHKNAYFAAKIQQLKGV